MKRHRAPSGVTLPTVYQLAVCCPECDRRPPIRITATERALHQHYRPTEICSTHHCRCGAVYPIPARAYQDAA